jgi:formyltetrahydrofolate deformylase
MRTEFEGEGEPGKIMDDLHQTLPTGLNLRLNPKKRKMWLSLLPKNTTAWVNC